MNTKHNYQAAINLFKARLGDVQRWSAVVCIYGHFTMLRTTWQVRKVRDRKPALFEHGDNRISTIQCLLSAKNTIYYRRSFCWRSTIDWKSYLNAVSLWQKHLQELPHNNNGMFAYYTGVALSRIGHDEDAMAYFQQVVERWPDFSKAWDAQLLVAQYIGRKSREGIISEKEAEEKMKIPMRILFVFIL